jgi:hypothetical protein
LTVAPILWGIIAFLAAGLVGVTVALILLANRWQSTESRYRQLVQGAEAGNLQEVLNQHLAHVQDVGAALEPLRTSTRDLQTSMRSALRHVGIVRFNPFADSGGDFSFAIALADDDGNGIVLYSLHGRGESRLYAKPLKGWTSPYALAGEEAEAIRLAQASPVTVETT